MLLFIGCSQSTQHIKFDCENSKNEIVKSKEDAIGIAIQFLNKEGKENYYKDSVSVFIDEEGNYNVSFIINDRIIPDNTMLIVRKNDGCVAKLLFE